MFLSLGQKTGYLSSVAVPESIVRDRYKEEINRSGETTVSRHLRLLGETETV